MDEYPNGNYCNTCTQECTNRLFKLLAYTRVAHSALALYLSLSTLAFIVYVRYFSSYYHLQCTHVYAAAKEMFLSVVFVMYFDYFLSGFPNYIQPWDTSYEMPGVEGQMKAFSGWNVSFSDITRHFTAHFCCIHAFSPYSEVKPSVCEVKM